MYHRPLGLTILDEIGEIDDDLRDLASFMHTYNRDYRTQMDSLNEIMGRILGWVTKRGYFMQDIFVENPDTIFSVLRDSFDVPVTLDLSGWPISQPLQLTAAGQGVFSSEGQEFREALFRDYDTIHITYSAPSILPTLAEMKKVCPQLNAKVSSRRVIEEFLFFCRVCACVRV